MNYNLAHRTPLDIVGSRAEGLTPLPFSEGLFKLSGSSGTLESAVLESPLAFDDLVGSWNARVPPGAVLELQVQTRGEGKWSRWVTLGRQEGDSFRSPGPQEDEWGRVDTDTLKLRRTATALRYRVLLTRGPGFPPVLTSVAFALSEAQAPDQPEPFSSGPWVRELKVRPRSQMEEQERYRHNICSPTTLAMALDYWGMSAATTKIADAVRDQATGMYGVWPFNTAEASRRGLWTQVARLESLADLEREIASDRPIAVSVTFGAGELDDAPLKKTKGHFLLVVGFTSSGDVIVLDPAAPNRAGVRRVYKRRQFHKVWRINKRGLAYLTAKPFGLSMTVGVPVADLWAKPLPRRKFSLSDPDHLSQLLYGESLIPLSVSGDWVKVLASEQLNFLESKKWQGYPGWVRAEHLTSSIPLAPNSVVRTRQTLVQLGENILALSVGTRLRRLNENGGVSSSVLLLDGRRGEVPSDSLYIPSKDPGESRPQAVKTAELFLGTSYYWGGRSGVQPEISVGVDCSGLTSLAHRTAGLDIPRDSHEQKLKARPLRSRDMKPGDLIFLSDSARSKTITHVILFTGGDGLIESRKSAGRTLRSSFRERFGKPLSELESGDTVRDLSFPKPRRRVLYFGTYFN